MLCAAEHKLSKCFHGRCQTYEGGIGGEPGNEAHGTLARWFLGLPSLPRYLSFLIASIGGYTFCGLAAMLLLRSVHKIDLDSLLVCRELDAFFRS